MTMRRFINSSKLLNEGSTGNRELDNHIEVALSDIPHPEDQEITRDLLFMVMNAGPEGISEAALTDHLEKLYPEKYQQMPGEMQTPNYEQALGLLRQYFPDLVDYHHDTGTYVWTVGQESPKSQDYPEIDMNDPTNQMAKTQIEITHDMLAKAKQLGEFTIGGLARVASARGIPSQMSVMLAQHVVDQFPKMFKHIDGEGVQARYSIVAEPARQDNMSLLRDLAARAAATGKIDAPSRGE